MTTMDKFFKAVISPSSNQVAFNSPSIPSDFFSCPKIFVCDSFSTQSTQNSSFSRQ